MMPLKRGRNRTPAFFYFWQLAAAGKLFKLLFHRLGYFLPFRFRRYLAGLSPPENLLS
jgi:hypothetical protein